MKRSIGCGLITEQQLNTTVTLAGWVDRRRDHGNVIFIDLRDQSGIMQIVFNPEISKEAHQTAESLRSEYVIRVSGDVVFRGEEHINSELPTGKYELRVNKIEIINPSKTLPFPLDAAEAVEEELKLRYRYLDLRRRDMLHHLTLRHHVALLIRNFLSDQKFLEIETPILTRSSREGAREFLTPSRLSLGHFYALPQSPQLYKQLLVAGGIEKYFQFARCFRDEDLRSDRQPEFTQFDMEMGFADETDVQSLIEELLNHIFSYQLGEPAHLVFDRLTHKDAMNRYGSDKPDLRFDMQLHDLTELFQGTELTFLKAVLKKEGKIGGFVIDQPNFTRSDLDSWVTTAQQLGAKGMVWIRIKPDRTAESPIAKFLPADFFQRLQTVTPVKPGDVLFIIAGPFTESWTLLGRLRLEVARKLNLIDESRNSFLWVTDFPLFEYDDVDKRWVATHHPFTAPQKGWKDLPPGDIKARAYDIVLNGVELGGGSIRIHEASVQREIFKRIGLSQKEIDETFGFLMEALEFGFPPLGGIAFGFDRLMMLMLRTPSIREVIPFPKTQRGHDPLMGAPSEVDPKLLEEYGLKIVKKKR